MATPIVDPFSASSNRSENLAVDRAIARPGLFARLRMAFSALVSVIADNDIGYDVIRINGLEDPQ
jgi:hypothetical protein